MESEGEGWLLPRFAAAPWPEFIPRAWQVTDEVDLAWMLERLRPTPFGQFTSPVQVTDPAAALLPRTSCAALAWPHAGFDRMAVHAGRTAGWRLCTLDASHLAYITSPGAVADVLLDQIETG